MKSFILFLVVVFISLSINASESGHDCSGHRHYRLLESENHPSDSALLDYDVKYYGISLEVTDTSTYIRGYTEILARVVQATGELVFELESGMGIDSVLVGGQIISGYTHEDDLIRIGLSQEIPAGELFDARVYYEGEGKGGGFFSGISNRKDSYWGNRVTYTLSEPFAAKDWFVCKQVLPDKADSAEIWLTVDEGLKAGSNGLLLGIDSLESGKLRFHWKTQYPIAYYLLSLSVSDYQEYNLYANPPGSSAPILIQNYIYDVPGYLDQAKDDIDETADMLELYSRLFTLYPFAEEKYGHSLAPMGGGMEHQTMTTLSSFRFTLVAHELMHQWFGDNVTCASWQDIWINEGFASYGEYIAIEELRSDEEARAWMQSAHQWAISEPEGSVYLPEEDAENIYRIFSMPLSYKKGAAILHMIRHELNDDSIFYRTLAEFQTQYKDSVATGDDFMKVLEEVSGKEFSWFFDQWYYGKGFPNFDYTWWHTGDSLIIECEQTGSSEETPYFQTSMEFDAGLMNGSDTSIRVFISKPYQRFSFSVPVTVVDIIPDPDNWVLDRSRSIRRILPQGQFSVNPNPFSDEFTLYFTGGPGTREVSLTDISGKVLDKVESSSNAITFYTQHLPPGVYLLYIKDGPESYSTKIIKQ